MVRISASFNIQGALKVRHRRNGIDINTQVLHQSGTVDFTNENDGDVIRIGGYSQGGAIINYYRNEQLIESRTYPFGPILDAFYI